jgi:hypothetical protein
VYNYSNERLQLAFNHYILQLEQKDYRERGIDVSEITFTDNSDCIASFEQVCRVDLDVEGPWPGDGWRHIRTCGLDYCIGGSAPITNKQQVPLVTDVLKQPATLDSDTALAELVSASTMREDEGFGDEQTSLEWPRPGTVAQLVTKNLAEEAAYSEELEKIRSSRHHRKVIRAVVDATTDPLLLASSNMERVE